MPSEPKKKERKKKNIVDLKNGLNANQLLSTATQLFPSKIVTWRKKNPLSLAVEVDGNKWKVVEEREAINICQYLSSIKI